MRGRLDSRCDTWGFLGEIFRLDGCAVVARGVKITPTSRGRGMQNALTRLHGTPNSVRAAIVGIALIALALGAWMFTAGHAEHRVPVAPILQSETTAGDSVTEPVTDTPTNTVVSVTEASAAGSQSLYE